MAKNLGTYVFAANFQVKAAEALDPRMVAASKADLINKANWPSDGDEIYVYKGLIVDCGEDGVYRLIDPAKALATDYSGWERIDAGGAKIDNIYTYKGSVASFEALPVINEVGYVYNVESAFSITTGEGDSTVTKEYPEGTNVAWNGNGWDPLAGSIDLSNYATKSEVSEVRTTANSNTTSIQELSTAIGAANAEIAKKVDAVEGSSLIPADKLALIDSNAGQIGQLIATDENLTDRVEVLEGLFKDSGSGGTIDLGIINSQIADHGTRITSLETDNTNNKSAIAELQNADKGFTTQIEAIVELNTQQTGQITGLTTELDTVKNSVSGHTTEIATLNTAVGTNTQAISEIKNSINGLAVKSVKEGDLVLAADSNGVLSTTLNLNSVKDGDKTYIQLTGIEGALVSRFDASEFVKDGMIDSVVYDYATNKMTITWNTDGGKQPTVIDMAGLVDTYTPGPGLTLVEGVFSTRLSSNENNKLTLAEDGSLLVDLSEDIAALENTMDAKINAAFAWINVQ